MRVAKKLIGSLLRYATGVGLGACMLLPHPTLAAGTHGLAAPPCTRGLHWIVSSGSLWRSREALPLDLQRKVFDSTCTFLLIGAHPIPAYRDWRVIRTGAAPRLDQVARLADERSLTAVLYDPEAWSLTPRDEQRYPAAATCKAGALVHAQGKLFIATPATDLVRVIAPAWARNANQYRTFVRLGLAGRIARCADIYEIQAQGSEADTEKFAAFVREEARQVRAVNPQAIVIAGLSTNPTGHRVTAQELVAAARSVRGVVDGFWLNIPAGGKYCPSCGTPQPQVARRLLLSLAQEW